ncbi:hypothetical protein SteCoe_30323 [Stentor coeruleus]|uniref:Uncharacterized protein n=1 Tax=Stentor coeruleus TaxID=5963 RepID=A0A1R2B3U5_9CILI|nr:hypothetical protein SteCoe_30323 [Stentor coeruleus]
MEKKADFSSTQEDLGLNAKIQTKSILRKIKPSNHDGKKYIKRSKTASSSDIVKKVNFPDRIKKPLYVIFEVEPIVYEDQQVVVKKSKNKGCTCVIY